MNVSVEKKIAILLPNLCGGGAERVFLNLAKHLSRQGYEVTFLLMQAQGELLLDLPKEISVVDLGARRIRHVFWPLVRFIRQKRPDAFLLGMWPLTIIGVLAHRFCGMPGNVLVSDHSHLSASPIADRWYKRLFLSVSMRVIYPLASARLAVSRGVARDLSVLSGLPQERFTVIYNPVVDESTFDEIGMSTTWSSFSGKRFLAVGSLKGAKDYPTLIKAFCLVNEKLQSTLVILGEGDSRPELEKLINSLGLTDTVHLKGFVADPTPWYLGADMFILSSLWEGLPTVLIEALNVGLPIVSTDCPSGPSEILENGRYGRLVSVGDPEALAEGILSSLHDVPDRDALKKRAKDFSVDKIARQYLGVMFPSTENSIEN